MITKVHQSNEWANNFSVGQQFSPWHLICCCGDVSNMSMSYWQAIVWHKVCLPGLIIIITFSSTSASCHCTRLLSRITSESKYRSYLEYGKKLLTENEKLPPDPKAILAPNVFDVESSLLGLAPRRTRCWHFLIVEELWHTTVALGEKKKKEKEDKW